MRALVLVLGLCVAGAASAQESGGSFGGGDFGGGGGGGDFGGGGGGGDWGGGGGYGGSSDWGSGGTYVYTGSGGGCAGAVVALVLVFAIGGFGAIARAAARSTQVRGPGRAYRAYGTMQVSQLQLGIDWRARRDVQQALAQLAGTGRAGTAEGRAWLLRETVLVLRRAEMSWLYAGYREQAGYAPQEAQGVFQMAAGDARARFRREVVRADGAQFARADAPGVTARPDEGEGVVVVTLVVAAWRPVRPIQNVQNAAEIRDALHDRASLWINQLAAIEVVWSPAVEDDRMSTAELEQFYPELRKIDPASIAGRVFCEYCRGPFAMELLACPHCGASVRRA